MSPAIKTPSITAITVSLSVIHAICPVVFDNVSMRYEGDSEDSLEHISLTVKRGERIGVIGGTGSGKSTLINLIPRFYDTREGNVLIDGRNVKEYKLDALRERIGIVPQKAVIFHGTVRDNMRWGKKDATEEEKQRIEELMKQMEEKAEQ